MTNPTPNQDALTRTERAAVLRQAATEGRRAGRIGEPEQRILDAAAALLAGERALPGPSRIVSSRAHVARQLRAYGEPAAAARLPALSEAQFVLVEARAFRYAFPLMLQPDARRVSLDMALALAAIEVVEGSARALRRKRRVYDR